MKKTFLLFNVLFIIILGQAQTAEGFNYKALLTDNGTAVANTSVSVKATIKNSSSGIVWQETHDNVTTDANGIFSISIGEGTRIDGAATFAEVNWSDSGTTLSIEVDAGNGYQALVTDESLKYVPYAKSSEKVTGIQEGFRIGGDYYMWNEVLHVEKDMTGSSGEDVVYIKVENPSAYDAAIEIDMMPANNAYYLLTPTLTLLSNGNIQTTGDVITNGKLKAASVSGDSDMKAYIYGYVYSGGTYSLTQSSDGFTVSRLSTGTYEITFNTPLSTSAYLVVANSYAATNPELITLGGRYNDHFILKSWKLSDGSLRDTDFQFVVFKK